LVIGTLFVVLEVDSVGLISDSLRNFEVVVSLELKHVGNKCFPVS